MAFLRQKSKNETNFIVFKTDCLSWGPRFSFPEDEIYDTFYIQDLDDEENDDRERKPPVEDISFEKANDLKLIISVSIGIIFVILAVIAAVCVLKRKKICCFQEGKKNEVDGVMIVHQNDLYGNLSNQEEWQERYDTNIIDTNTYYEDFNSGEQYEQNEDDKDKADTKDSTKEDKDQESKV